MGRRRKPFDQRPQDASTREEEALPLPEVNPHPADALPPSYWQKGALLNVRNYGSEYIVTLWPEEFDQRHPENSLHFTNPARCQDFVSKWYGRQSHDPRAYR